MPYSIMMDAGHGGRDPGAVYNGRQEKDDTLRLALAVGAAASLPIVPAAAERLGTRGRAAAESVCFLLAAALFCLCLPAVAAGGFESFIYAQF